MLYPWYELAKKSDKSLHQGDLIKDCPIIIPPSNMNTESINEANVQCYNVVVMSQSCDLEYDKIEIVLVCPYMTWENFLIQQPQHLQSKKGRNKLFEQLKQGIIPSYHLLNAESKVNLNDYIVVDFRYVYGIHYDYLKEYRKLQKNLIRLLPPYREHLSQAFARFFMRVGLPIDIPSIH